MSTNIIDLNENHIITTYRLLTGDISVLSFCKDSSGVLCSCKDPSLKKLEELEVDNINIAIAKKNKNKNLIKKFNIERFPTVLMLKNGKEVKRCDDTENVQKCIID